MWLPTTTKLTIQSNFNKSAISGSDLLTDSVQVGRWRYWGVHQIPRPQTRLTKYIKRVTLGCVRKIGIFFVAKKYKIWIKNNFTIELFSISFYNKSAEFDILDCEIKTLLWRNRAVTQISNKMNAKKIVEERAESSYYLSKAVRLERIMKLNQ